LIEHYLNDFLLNLKWQKYEDDTFLNLLIENLKVQQLNNRVEKILNNNQKSIVYITDTGYINRKYLKKLENKNIYYIESNHDEEMLMNGPYPYLIKQRILSDEGHLSNKRTASYLKKIVGTKTKYIILAHLSEKNNTEELAYNTTKEAMDDINYQESILITKQNEALEMVEV